MTAAIPAANGNVKTILAILLAFAKFEDRPARNKTSEVRQMAISLLHKSGMPVSGGRCYSGTVWKGSFMIWRIHGELTISFQGKTLAAWRADPNTPEKFHNFYVANVEIETPEGRQIVCMDDMYEILSHFLQMPTEESVIHD